MVNTETAGHGAEIRQRILDAAAEVFAEHGFGGAGVDEIARRAGVNKAMLYYHVGDKAALFGEVVKTNIALIGRAVADAVSASIEPRERLRAIPRAFARAALERPFLPQLMLREIAGGGPNIPAEALSQIAKIMGVTKAVLEDGLARGVFRRAEPFIIHLLLIGSLMFMANALRMRQRFGQLLPFPPEVGNLEALTDQMVEIALDGIAISKA
jgi:TetR/AcrR family transcriptional regulator